MSLLDDTLGWADDERVLARTAVRCNRVHEYAFGLLPFATSGTLYLTDRRVLFAPVDPRLGRWEVEVARIVGTPASPRWPRDEESVRVEYERPGLTNGSVTFRAPMHLGEIEVDQSLEQWLERLESLRTHGPGPPPRTRGAELLHSLEARVEEAAESLPAPRRREERQRPEPSESGPLAGYLSPERQSEEQKGRHQLVVGLVLCGALGVAALLDSELLTLQTGWLVWSVLVSGGVGYFALNYRSGSSASSWMAIAGLCGLPLCVVVRDPWMGGAAAALVAVAYGWQVFVRSLD